MQPAPEAAAENAAAWDHPSLAPLRQTLAAIQACLDSQAAATYPHDSQAA